MILPFHNEIQHLFSTISAYRIVGLIPLGMILHIGISAIITIALLKYGMAFEQVVIIVFLVGLSKEFLDSFVINNTMTKHLLDLCYDMSYPAILLLIRKIKSRPPG